MDPTPSASPQRGAQLLSTSESGEVPGGAEAAVYVFDEFRLDVRRRRLSRGTEPVALPPKAIETLLVLIEHRHRVVEKDELMRRLWPDTVVEEANLTQHVFTIRKALREKPGEHRFIATAARRGYRFVADVRVENGNEAPPSTAVTPDSRRPARRLRAAIPIAAAVVTVAGLATWGLWSRWPPAAAQPIRTIAVLPFQNVSGDPAQEYFADGVTDAVITDLASIRALRIVSRQSVMRFRNSREPLQAIGRQLGADAVVQGTVATGAGRVRVTAQLVDARTDAHLWARSYDRRLGDVLSIQGEIARAVAAAVDVTVQEHERAALAGRESVDPEALRPVPSRTAPVRAEERRSAEEQPRVLPRRDRPRSVVRARVRRDGALAGPHRLLPRSAAVDAPPYADGGRARARARPRPRRRARSPCRRHGGARLGLGGRRTGVEAHHRAVAVQRRRTPLVRLPAVGARPSPPVARAT